MNSICTCLGTYLAAIALIAMAPGCRTSAPPNVEVHKRPPAPPASPALAKLQLPPGPEAEIVAAVTELLEHGRADEIAALAELLIHSPQNMTRDAIIKALAAHQPRPPVIFAPALLTQLNAPNPAEPIDPAMASQFAAALGRSLEAEHIPLLAEAAYMVSLSPDRRRIAIAALGYLRHRASADALHTILTAMPYGPYTEQAAGAMARLAARDELADDPAACAAWYARYEHLKPGQWLQAVSEDVVERLRTRLEDEQRTELRLAQSARQLTNVRTQLNDTRQRLLDTQRRLYRASDQAQQAELLATWLEDPQSVTRLLAVELADQLADEKQLDETMLALLRKRMGDDVPAVRRQAALMLWRLEDEPAADIAAERVARGDEADLEVVKAQLLIMSDMPRAPVVAAMLNMLPLPDLQPEAAAALAAAFDAGLLEAAQTTDIRALLKSIDGGPEPRIVALIARVGDDEDWQRIEAWLDDDDENLRDAAARAWADGDRPLEPLAQRADDPVIQQILIPAARRRGRTDATMLLLLEHRPEKPQTVEQWQRALQAVAQRIAARTIIEADRVCQQRGDDLPLRQSLLSAGIARLNEQAEPLTNDQIAVMADLLVRRAQVRLDIGQPQPALADLQQIGELPNLESTGRFALQLSMSLMRAHLALPDVPAAANDAAEAMALATDLQLDEQVRSDVADYFIAAANDLLTAEQYDAATQLTAALRTLLGDDLPEKLARQLTDIEETARNATQATDAAE